ncbi:MAG: EamA family transporter [Lachnospiraceae bacterium]|nr:EamA family transporter [Lachnospiraceae bacterium]MBQ5660819.1 EamA family transporter [Lachnospiraceae bacterium]
MATKDTMKSGMSDTIGILMTIAGGCLWGLSAACGQFLFDVKGATAKWMVPIRLILAGSLMLFYYIISEKKEAFRIWKKKRDAIDVMIYGLAGLMLCQFTYYYTIELSNAGTATVLQYISPVLIMILVCINEKRIPKIMEVVALVLAVLGIFLIATHGDIKHLAISKEALVIGLFSAWTVVIYNMQPKRLMRYYPTPYLLAWGMVIGGIVLAMLFKPWQYEVHVDLGVILAFGTIVLLGTISSFSLYMQGVKLIGPGRASLYCCVEPIAATLICAVWLKEPFAAIDIVGFLCIIATILILGFLDLKKGK